MSPRLSFQQREKAHEVTHLSAYGTPIDTETADLVRRYVVELEHDLSEYAQAIDELLGGEPEFYRPCETVHVTGGVL